MLTLRPPNSLEVVDPSECWRRELDYWAEKLSVQQWQDYDAALKKHDPNHLNLGMRGGGRPTESEILAARAFDVYSVNVYDAANDCFVPKA